ncbi:MAG: DUF433 domain-containing protein [Caldilineaceae bacterium]|nr:DUF433 domain-containing protein [Caldilineaceae bacterium]
MTIRELEQELMALPSVDKARILQTLVADLTDRWPGIEKVASVVDGDACIVRTRIPVWGLEEYRRMGWSDQQILENFPSLSQQDLENAWLYVLSHKEEIDQAIHDNEEV